jgi:hypothetical protein
MRILTPLRASALTGVCAVVQAFVVRNDYAVGLDGFNRVGDFAIFFLLAVATVFLFRLRRLKQ